MLGRSRFVLRRLSRFCLMSHAICFRFGVDMRNRGLNAELIPTKISRFAEWAAQCRRSGCFRWRGEAGIGEWADHRLTSELPCQDEILI